MTNSSLEIVKATKNLKKMFTNCWSRFAIFLPHMKYLRVFGVWLDALVEVRGNTYLNKRHSYVILAHWLCLLTNKIIHVDKVRLNSHRKSGEGQPSEAQCSVQFSALWIWTLFSLLYRLLLHKPASRWPRRRGNSGEFHKRNRSTAREVPMMLELSLEVPRMLEQSRAAAGNILPFAPPPRARFCPRAFEFIPCSVTNTERTEMDEEKLIY